MRRPAEIPRIALPWIVRARWAMVLGQLTIPAVANWLLAIDLPLASLAIPPLLTGSSNVWLSRRATGAQDQATESALIFWLFVFDTLCLTAILMLSGGPMNPFSLIYLVHITLASSILTRRHTWLLGALAPACFGLLFWKYQPIPQLGTWHHGEPTSLHLIGMWVGFTATSLMVTLFSGKISDLLRQREESLRRMQEEFGKKDRLAALATLAAGAAHELGTPLGTIAIVCRELELYATRSKLTTVAEDCRVIRSEVERCRQVLWRMSEEGVEPRGEALQRIPVGELLESIKGSLPFEDQLRVHVEPAVRETPLVIPKRAVHRALAALLRNAHDASPPGAVINVVASSKGTQARFEIRDSGSGMDSESLRHVGEPFFTTKEPGRGMGLGVFLVRTLTDQLGGRLTIESSLGEGTLVTLTLPVVPASEEVSPA